MAAIVVEVPCSGSVHRLELHDDGTVEMLDHDEAVVRAFVAFNAEPPECLAALDEAREDPVDVVLAHAEIEDKVRGLLACDFAEHVLHIFEARYPDDNRPRRAIQVTRAYWRGKATREQLNEARAAARVAAWSAKRSADAADDAAARAAARAARSAAYAAERVVWAEGGAYAAAIAVARAARSAESRWQLSRIFRVLDALERGKRWPRLS